MDTISAIKDSSTRNGSGIDSELVYEIERREKMLKGIAKVANVMLETSSKFVAFTGALHIFIEMMQADRAYICENSVCPQSGKMLYNIRYKQYRSGFEPLIGNVSNPDTGDAEIQVPVAESGLSGDEAAQARKATGDCGKGTITRCYETIGFKRWLKVFSRRKCVHGPAVGFPEAEKKVLLSFGIFSIMIAPIYVDDKLWGFISLEDCTSDRKWLPIEEDVMQMAASGVSCALKRFHSEETLMKVVHDDFRKVVQNLQNLIFKLALDKSGNLYFTLFEGRIASELGYNTHEIYGRKPNEVFDANTAKLIDANALKAFKGYVRSFDITVNDRIYYITLSLVVDGDEVGEVVGSAIDMTEYRNAAKRVEHLAYHDLMTGLPNHAMFNDRLTMAINEAKRSGKIFTVMLLDLDKFKVINDTLGHTAGDVILNDVATRLKSCIRRNDTVSRMYGDEFIVLFTDIKEAANAVVMSKRVTKAFIDPFIVSDHELFVTASVGISVYPFDGHDIETLIKSADIALQIAKENGRNCCQFYSSSMDTYAMERLKMESNLRKALDKNEFRLVYQPIINITTGRITGCEALLRWDNCEIGAVPPNVFIPIAEEGGFIVPIEEWVLKTACMQNAYWREMGCGELRISVNISAKHFQYGNIVDTVKRILDETGIQPEYLELEITENCIMQNTEKTFDIIDRLKSIGVGISIDDFGTGFSSLAYLKRFKVDKLKIDRSFIIEIVTNRSDAAICSTITHMAHSLNLVVVAEGVETSEQLQKLDSIKCDEVQGYYFSKPLKAEDFCMFVKDHCKAC